MGPPSTRALRDPLLEERLGGRYRLVQLLATGGVGRIYLALEAEPGAGEGSGLFAVKVLRPEHRRRGDLVARFRREAEAASRIAHPAVLRVLARGETQGGLPFFAMDLLEGVDLADALARSGSLPPAEAARIAASVADGLEAAHRAGVVHRDVKPENIFLREAAGLPRGEAVTLLDFGFAHLRGDPEPAPSRSGRASVVGTPEYMAPEQAQGAPAGPRADVYSLGIVLYEMLAGRLPFTGDYPAIALRHVHEPPPPLREVAPAPLSEPLGRAVALALAKDPRARHPSAAALRDALLACPELAASGA